MISLLTPGVGVGVGFAPEVEPQPTVENIINPISKVIKIRVDFMDCSRLF
jgi:hypothetical protein